MHTHQADSFVLGVLFWATKYVCYYMALYFAFHGAGNLVRATGHVFNFAFKTFHKYSFGFFFNAVFCFAVAAAFYLATTPKFWAFIQPYFFKNAIITFACEVVLIILPINLLRTFNFEAEKHQYAATNQEAVSK